MKQNKKIYRLLLLLFIIMALGMSITVLVSAQTRANREPEALANSSRLIPTGVVPTYYFSGVSDSQNSTPDTSATVVHCTNLSLQDADVTVYMADWDAVPVISGTGTIYPNYTLTFVSHNSPFYSWDVGLSSTIDDLNQGYGWVVSSVGDQLICTAQVMDPVANPTYAVKLDLYDSNYQLITPDVGSPLWDIYLPATLKE